MLYLGSRNHHISVLLVRERVSRQTHNEATAGQLFIQLPHRSLLPYPLKGQDQNPLTPSEDQRTPATGLVGDIQTLTFLHFERDSWLPTSPDPRRCDYIFEYLFLILTQIPKSDTLLSGPS